MTPNVIDIYHGNVVHDFYLLKAAGVEGVIHKATQGVYYADPMYAERRQKALDAGLLWGAYAFNTGQDVGLQVGAFLAHAQPDAQTLVALDFEDNPATNMTLAQAREWLERCADALGRKAVLYSGNRIKDLMGDAPDEFFGSHRLWLAQYGPVAKVQPSWSKQWLWQYSETGKLSGTDGTIDLNFYDGSPNDLATEWAS